MKLSFINAPVSSFNHSKSQLYHLFHFFFSKIGLQLEEIRDCVVWMIPFALTIRDEGFDPKVIKKGVDEESLSNLQSHTVDLKLLVS